MNDDIRKYLNIDYYYNAVNDNNIVDVISADEFIKLIDKSERNHIRAIQSMMQPNNCYSNSIFICDFDDSFEYVEGVMKSDEFNTMFHHSLVYSTKYDVYVDFTTDIANHKYYVSNHLNRDETSAFIKRCTEYDEDEDDSTLIPQFYNNDNIPLYWKD